MKLAISLATRGRPTQVIDTVIRSMSNWEQPGTTLYIMADQDDLPTIEAVQKLLFTWNALGRRIFMSVNPREDTIAEKWNRVTTLAPDADVYLVQGDDDPVVTPGYDTKILQAAARFPDGIGMVYGHMANASFSGVVAPTAGFVKKLGHIFPPLFPYWFVDHWTDDVARLIDRISFADVRTDQSRAGVTQEKREPGWWGTFFDAAYLMRRKIARDIIMGEDFQEPFWRKEMLLAHAPLIEVRSKWINDNVRASSKEHDRWSGLSLVDERYQRVRQRAVDLLPHLFGDCGMEPAEAAAYQNALNPPRFVPALAVNNGWL